MAERGGGGGCDLGRGWGAILGGGLLGFGAGEGGGGAVVRRRGGGAKERGSEGRGSVDRRGVGGV